MKKLVFLTTALLLTLSFVINYTPTGLNVGDAAPDFTAKNQSQQDVNLQDLLKSGPVVLVFYRGEWCPYCSRQLKALEDSLVMIEAKGASVVAISPEKMENINKTIEKTKATYSILSDENLKIMNDYKVSFELDEETTTKYKGYGINLMEKNGSNGNNLPVPAVYVISRDGKISYRHFDVNYKNRVSVKEILKNI